ncbi:MAG TPA: response regulator [Vicinamibacterales bacterium]|nr:response regulator [Vicinamibacterales bacterium]
MPKPRVLIVDDYPGARYRRMRMLTEAGRYEVVEEILGRDAVRRAAQGDIDLVLVDLHLPDITGLEVCDALKGNAATAGIPVVLMSAVAEQQEAAELASRHGAAAFVADAADSATLLAAVEAALPHQA